MRRKIKFGSLFICILLSTLVLSVLVSAETTGSCGTSVNYTLDDSGVLTISGSGAMTNYSNYRAVPWYSNVKSIVKVEVGEGVTSVGDSVFRGCVNLEEVVLPESITYIGKYAFYNCRNLPSVEIGENVTEIGSQAFENCEMLSSLKIPKSVEIIGEYAFEGCAENFSATVYYGSAAESYCVENWYGYTVICTADFYSDEQLVKTEEYSLGASVVMPENIEDKEAYNFCGWELDGIKYNAGDSVIIEKNITVNAVWEIKTYSIVFECGGAEAIEPIIKKHGEDIMLPSEIVKEGYNFLGWSTAQDSADVQYQPGEIFSLNETTYLYAVWKEKTYTVSFDANGGEGTFAPQTKYHFTTLQLTDNVPVKAGSTFMGWGISSEAVQPRYQPGELIDANENMTLYAVWKDGITTGDADLSGDINISDLLMMMQRLNNYNVEYSEDNKFAMDVFGDTYFNIKDVLKMAQYLAGWSNIVLGEGN